MVPLDLKAVVLTTAVLLRLSLGSVLQKAKENQPPVPQPPLKGSDSEATLDPSKTAVSTTTVPLRLSPGSVPRTAQEATLLVPPPLFSKETLEAPQPEDLAKSLRALLGAQT